MENNEGFNNFFLCRICYGTEEDCEKLISPCRCAGTVRFVHENCLKTWLVATNAVISTHRCELCHTKYKIESYADTKIYFKGLCKESLVNRIFTGILFIIGAMLVVLISFLGKNYQKTESNDKGYLLAVIIVCVFACFAVFFFVGCILKGMITRKIEVFRIQNYLKEVVVEIKTMSSPLITEIKEKKPEREKYNGRKTVCAKVVPLMQVPIFEGKRLIGYTKMNKAEYFSNSAKELSGKSQESDIHENLSSDY